MEAVQPSTGHHLKQAFSSVDAETKRLTNPMRLPERIDIGSTIIATYMPPTRQDVFITGGTGYMGSRLIPRLRTHGHRIRALVRPGSEAKLPPGCEAVVGNALDASSYKDAVQPATTFIQLVGVAHPAPMMKAYIEVRTECERLIRESGMNATILRPWYVLGPRPSVAVCHSPVVLAV